MKTLVVWPLLAPALLVGAALQIVPSGLPALVKDNPSIDNGPAIKAWILRGKRLPPGMYFFSTKIHLPPNKPGMSLRGNGMPDQVRGNGVWDEADNQVATILIWNGDPNGTLIELNSGAFVMEDIGIQGRSVALYNDLTDAHRSAVLFKMYQSDPDPPAAKWFAVGNITFERCMFGLGSIGIYASGDDHCDHVSIRDCVMHWVTTPIKSVERQSVEWEIEALTCAPGSSYKGSALLDFERGGRVRAQLVPLNAWESLIKLPIIPEQEAAYNSGYFDIFVWLDNSARFDATIVERDDDENAACAVNITGYSSKEVTFPDPEPQNSTSEFRINVQRVGGAGEDFIYPDEE